MRLFLFLLFQVFTLPFENVLDLRIQFVEGALFVFALTLETRVCLLVLGVEPAIFGLGYSLLFHTLRICDVWALRDLGLVLGVD